jgi:DNA-binding IclR family transcriptional regulator
MKKNSLPPNNEPDRVDDMQGASGIRVIARAADILKALGRHPEGMSLREIADSVDLPRSTVQRIVKALDDVNFVIAASATSGVCLSPALSSLAQGASESELLRLCRPSLVKLNKDCGETVDFAVFGNDKAVVVDQLPGVHRLVAVTAIGSSLPLHASASGKALLAEHAPHEFAALRKRYRLVQFTKTTVTNWAELETELAQIRRDGIAYDREECFVGIRCVAKSLRGPNGEVGAISIPVPKERFESTKDELAQILLRRCGTLQRRFSP